jgi:hypothetical protein
MHGFKVAARLQKKSGPTKMSHCPRPPGTRIEILGGSTAEPHATIDSLDDSLALRHATTSA